MAQSYVPEGTMIVCNAAKKPMDNTFISNRKPATVLNKEKSAILLNNTDFKLEAAFVCNFNSKFWGGLKMLGAIVAIGALAILTVATGGTILFALAAAVAVTAAATSAYSAVREIVHDCDATLTSKWIGFHGSVKFNKKNALLQSSTMICVKGGALAIVVDPVLARAAMEKIAANNTEEYYTHLNSQIIQGGMFVLSSGGDPRALAFGYPLTVYNYVKGENKKDKERAKEIEGRITGEIKAKEGGLLDILPDKDGSVDLASDTAIGILTEASYSPEMITAMANNANIIKAYPAIVTASLGSQFPMASLRLNSSLYFAAARQTFNPGVIKSLGSGLAWGVGGALVDGASDQYEKSIYDDTIKYLTEFLSVQNKKSKGINIIANKT